MHDLAAIERATVRLMDDLGRQHLGEPLQARGWTFAFDRARRRLGACHWSKTGPERRLTLSGIHAARLGWSVMEDVARHEIAHALDVETRGRSGHDAVWKTWARRCGADPTRLYEGLPPDDGADAPYVGTCPACGTTRGFYRRPTRRYACATCCRQHAAGRFDPRFALRITPRSVSSLPTR